MNTLSIFNPNFSSNLFDLVDDVMNYEFPAKRKESFPPMDIIETKDGYTFEMELCGLSENDIDLSIKDQVLSIGTKKSDEKEVVTNQNSTENKSIEETKGGTEEKKYLLKERRKISFNRKFTLSQNVDVEKVSAKFVNGLLTIQVPKKPEAELKRIQINVA